ncbi:MAG: hypothetical protein LBG66_02170 [Gallionellaceae bacterium]|jgi:hypothetical protein|nr:hypothetical protein [Gallionellaceae bacterium]
MKSVFRFGALLLLATLDCSAVWAQTAPPAQPDQAVVDQLTDLAMQAAPFDKVFQQVLKEDARWPLNDVKSDAVTPERLQCMRDQFSDTGYRAVKQQEVIDFMNRYPGEVDDSVRLLKGGAAEIFGAYMQQGIDEGMGQKDESKQVSIDQFTPEQVSAFLDLTSNSKYSHLRELLGLGGAPMLNTNLEPNADGVELTVSRLMLRAMNECKIPLSVLK